MLSYCIKCDNFLLTNKVKYNPKVLRQRSVFKYILETACVIYFHHPISTISQPRKSVWSAFWMAFSDLQPKESVPPGVVSFHLHCKYLFINTSILHNTRLLLRQVANCKVFGFCFVCGVFFGGRWWEEMAGVVFCSLCWVGSFLFHLHFFFLLFTSKDGT